MTIMTETITPTLDYKVADISLAEFGRKGNLHRGARNARPHGNS